MDIPKIQTDSKEDIHFLISQLQNAANEATAQHFATNPVDEPTQSQVQKLMSQVSISFFSYHCYITISVIHGFNLVGARYF
jgi:hypothetical protein